MSAGFISHAAFFLSLSFVIVVMSAFYSEPADGPAFRSIGRRYFVFVVSCAAIAGVMLAAEAIFAGVS